MDTKHAAYRNDESGNVMFYIFAGIALLVALTFAVSQGNRTSVTSLSDDRAQLYAGEILEYGDAVAKTVSMMRLRGFPENMIDFDTAGLTGYDNGNCTEAVCEIFNPSGGELNYIAPPTDWLDAGYDGQSEYGNVVFSGDVCVPLVGAGNTDCATDVEDNEELMMFVPYVNRAVCMKVNDLLSVANPSNAPPVLPDCAWENKFTGSFSDNLSISGGSTAGLAAQSAGCVQVTNCGGQNDSYHVYQVLIAR